MTHLFHRSLLSQPPVVAGGQGVELFDINGKSYIDGSGGAAVSCLGHGHPAVLDAIKKQVDQIAYAHTGFFTSHPAEQLADMLCAAAPESLQHVLLVSGGSEAVEAALKLARQYWVERGETRRRHIIARRQSYHGNTLGALAAGGNMPRRRDFAPLLIQTHHVDPCFAFRYKGEDETEEEYGLRAAASFEEKILELGPDTIIAFVAETVVGATSGAVPATPGYFRKIREICDRYGILLILDEVMCGMGRTGSRYAFQQEGIVPDICTMAKGLGGGYLPIGAIIASARIYETIRNGSGAFKHGHTYQAHPTSAAAALAVQSVIEREGILDHVRAMGDVMENTLREALGDLEWVGDIRGRGLLWGVEIVENRGPGNPAFAPDKAVSARIKEAAFRNGLIIYPNGGTIDGTRGDHVLIAPPFIITPGQIERIGSILRDSIEDVLAGG